RTQKMFREKDSAVSACSACSALSCVISILSERPAEAKQHLERTGDGVELVAEIDAGAANRQTEADTLEPSRIRSRRGPQRRPPDRHPSSVEESEHLDVVAPSERVLEID